MTTLPEILTDPTRRPKAVEALAGVVQAEVASKSGLSGMALKTAYKAVSKISPDLVLRAVDYMLPDFAEQLDPFWSARADQPFGSYLSTRGEEAAEALLEVTDSRAAKPDHAAIARIYHGVRAKAKAHVQESLPRLGTAIESLAQ